MASWFFFYLSHSLSHLGWFQLRQTDFCQKASTDVCFSLFSTVKTFLCFCPLPSSEGKVPFVVGEQAPGPLGL